MDEGGGFKIVGASKTTQPPKVEYMYLSLEFFVDFLKCTANRSVAGDFLYLTDLKLTFHLSEQGNHQFCLTKWEIGEIKSNSQST